MHFILERGIIEKMIFVNKSNQFYCKRINENPVIFEDLCSLHKEDDQKLLMHAVYPNQSSQMILMFLFSSCLQPNILKILLFFCQVKNCDTEGTTYHNINSVSYEIGAEISEILSCFQLLAGSDFMNPFFGKTKVQSFEQMVAAPSTLSLLSSMKLESVDIQLR